MNNEQNKPAEELKEKELEGVVGGAWGVQGYGTVGSAPLCDVTSAN